MPICKKCETHFPNRITIDGKKRGLGNRKYCLKCSPFGKHNTKQIHEPDPKTRECEQCGRRYEYKRHSGHTKTRCNSCLVNTRRFALKKRMVEYKGGKCTRCGYDRCIAALDFHHIDPKTKKFDVSGSHCLSWSKIKMELDKCELICSNCHREEEYGSLRTCPRRF